MPVVECVPVGGQKHSRDASNDRYVSEAYLSFNKCVTGT